jgi:predicted ABC-class ATPase
MVVTVPDAVGIRVEEGRKVESVDISPVMKDIAPGIDTARYCSKSAPPAVSFAANLMESLEIGTSLLIFDDETTVPNFIGRDARMQSLIPDGEEPLIPLVNILPVLRDEHGISSVVVGGTGDYFDIADTVIVLDEYQPRVATEEAKRIAFPGRVADTAGTFRFPKARRPLTGSLKAPKSDSRQQPQFFGRGIVKYGDEAIDLSRLTQIVSQSQARAVARAIAMVYKLMDSSSSLGEAVCKVMERVEKVGLDTLSSRRMGDLSMFRAHELAAAINRMKELKIL